MNMQISCKEKKTLGMQVIIPLSKRGPGGAKNSEHPCVENTLQDVFRETTEPGLQRDATGTEEALGMICGSIQCKTNSEQFKEAQLLSLKLRLSHRKMA